MFQAGKFPLEQLSHRIKSRWTYEANRWWCRWYVSMSAISQPIHPDLLRRTRDFALCRDKAPSTRIRDEPAAGKYLFAISLTQCVAKSAPARQINKPKTCDICAWKQKCMCENKRQNTSMLWFTLPFCASLYSYYSCWLHWQPGLRSRPDFSDSDSDSDSDSGLEKSTPTPTPTQTPTPTHISLFFHMSKVNAFKAAIPPLQCLWCKILLDKWTTNLSNSLRGSRIN